MKSNQTGQFTVRAAGAVLVGLILMGGPAAAQEPNSGEATSEMRSSQDSFDLFRSMRRMASPVTVSGFVRNETAYRIHEPNAFTKILNLMVLDVMYPLNPQVGLLARIRGHYDSVYDLVDIDTISPRKGPLSIIPENLSVEEVEALRMENVRDVEVNQMGLELREFYLDYHRGFVDLRVGKQIVRWGVVEGARVTDEINPLDLGEFILREVEERYIPLWMVKGNLYVGNWTLEGIWIPDLQFHRPAPRDSEWEQFRFLPNLIKPVSPLNNILEHYENSELAVKLSWWIKGWDISLSYFYTWDDFPAAFRAVDIFGFGATPQFDTVAFQPRYTRLKIPGIVVSKSLGKVVLNAEAAYVGGKVLGARVGSLIFQEQPDEAIRLGEIQRDFVKYAVSLDTVLWGTEVSGQILQQFILDYEPRIIQDEMETVLALFIRRELIPNIMTGQALVLYFHNDMEWLVRPRLDYRLTDQMKLSFGADLLFGTISDVGPDGIALPGEFHFAGFFRNNTRVYTELQYSF